MARRIAPAVRQGAALQRAGAQSSAKAHKVLQPVSTLPSTPGQEDGGDGRSAEELTPICAPAPMRACAHPAPGQGGRRPVGLRLQLLGQLRQRDFGQHGRHLRRLQPSAGDDLCKQLVSPFVAPASRALWLTHLLDAVRHARRTGHQHPVALAGGLLGCQGRKQLLRMVSVVHIVVVWSMSQACGWVRGVEQKVKRACSARAAGGVNAPEPRPCRLRTAGATCRAR